MGESGGASREPDPEELFSEYLDRLEGQGEAGAGSWLREAAPGCPGLQELVEDYREGAAGLGLGSANSTQVPTAVSSGAQIGDFRLIRRLGSGGQGTVWEAEQLSLGRRVALKFVRPEQVTEHTVAMLAREARAGGQLTHPGIVAVHGYGETNGLHWIAQELVPGGRTLREFIDETRAEIEVPKGHYRYVAELVAQIADSLESAHSAGVIHRDIKPLNVLLSPEGLPKITDFGMARVAGDTGLSVSGEVLGTYMYMSPEQVESHKTGTDHRSDIFSLGIVLYELLALQRPFEGDSTMQVAFKILKEDPPDLRRLRSMVPRELALIAPRALEKAKDRRYQSMAEFAADLRRWLNDESVSVSPPTAWDRAARWMRRHPARAGIGFISAVFCTALLALMTDRLKTNAVLAESGRDLLLLTDQQRLEDLLEYADSLWPPHPDKIDVYAAWVSQAEALAYRLPQHTTHLRRQEQLVRQRTAGEPDGESSSLYDHLLPVQSLDDSRTASRWWLNQFIELTAGLSRLQDPASGLLARNGISPTHGWSVPKRLAFAVDLEVGYSPGGQYHVRWEAALPAIAAAYEPYEIPIQMGLVPIGPDPESGLWEFWHIQSGLQPKLAHSGQLEITGATGLILVLIPGGTYRVGSQSDDVALPLYDPWRAPEERAAAEVSTAPYFLSKYEMTVGQWARSTGIPPGIGLHRPASDDEMRLPVSLVSWASSTEVLAQLGLALPTGIEWEVAARGGASTPWWTGKDPSSLAGGPAGNLYRIGMTAPTVSANEPRELWMESGFASAAPVGSFQANPFGIHDVHGNVWEWCRSDEGGQTLEGVPFTDSPEEPAEAVLHSARGGSYRTHALRSRFTSVSNGRAETELGDVGLRPARALDPPGMGFGEPVHGAEK